MSRQIRLKIISKACQIVRYIEKGAFYCFSAGDLFWDFAGENRFVKFHNLERGHIFLSVPGTDTRSHALPA